LLAFFFPGFPARPPSFSRDRVPSSIGTPLFWGLGFCQSTGGFPLMFLFVFLSLLFFGLFLWFFWPPPPDRLGEVVPSAFLFFISFSPGTPLFSPTPQHPTIHAVDLTTSLLGGLSSPDSFFLYSVLRRRSPIEWTTRFNLCYFFPHSPLTYFPPVSLFFRFNSAETRLPFQNTLRGPPRFLVFFFSS